MQTRKLGKSGLEVSALGLGCMRMSFGDRPTEAGDDRLPAPAVERGITFFDTAEVYGPFTNEELVGEALEPFKATWSSPPSLDGNMSEKGPHPRLWAGQPPRADQTGGRGIAQAPAGRGDRSVLPAPPGPERAHRGRGGGGEGSDPGRQGQALWACPKSNADQIRRAHAVQPVTALQSEYSIWWRAI